jgi:hypothetical protein
MDFFSAKARPKEVGAGNGRASKFDDDSPNLSFAGGPELMMILKAVERMSFKSKIMYSFSK